MTGVIHDTADDVFEVTRAGLAALFDHVDEAVLCCEEQGMIRFASDAVRTLMGFDPVTMVGRSIVDFVHPDDADDVIEAMARWVGRSGTPRGERVKVRLSDGSYRDVFYDAALGTAFGSFGSLIVTLRANELADDAGRSFRLQSLNGDRIVRLASTFLHVSFEDFDQGIEVALAELASLDWVTRASIWLVDGDRATLRAQWVAPVKPPTIPLYPRVRISDYPVIGWLSTGSEIHLGAPWQHGDEFDREREMLKNAGVSSMMAAPMLSAGKFAGMVMIESTLELVAFDAIHATTLRSATAILAEAFVRHETERKLAEQARTDRVTGLANRWAFDEALNRALAEVAAGRSPGLGLAIVDLDHFKLVNDSLGHEAGDELLADVAVRLSGAATVSTIVARLGGDEMLVLVDRSPSPAATLAALQGLAKSMAVPFEVGGTVAAITVSIGALHQSDGDTSVGELLRWVDLAVGRAKALGGDTIEMDDPADRLGQSSRMRRVGELRQALDDDQFTVHYQGEWELDSGALVGAEALVRWDHPGEGLLAAGEFVPLAEATGLIVDLGTAVLREACRTAMPWAEAFDARAGADGRSFVLRVNVAAHQLLRHDLVEIVSDALTDSGLPAGSLCLELTESALLADPAGSAEQFRQLRELGVGLAIDDFGTGYSSLLQLKLLPLTALKIDRAFVDGLPDDANDLAIVEATLGLAATLGFSVTAEGVETEAQRAALIELGCTRAQGFLVAMPEPADIFAARVAAALA